MAPYVRAILALIPIIVAVIYGPSLQRPFTVFGVLRNIISTPLASPEDIVVIDDTVHCEDVHYYAPSNILFTACEDDGDTRFGWFPGLATLKDPERGIRGRGSIHVIDVATKRSQRLELKGFEGTFVTHGLDIIDDLEAKEPAVYIFAVNHVPNPDYVASLKAPGSASDIDKSASRIEIFRHVLGSTSAQHVQTIQHPLVRTPNDIWANQSAPHGEFEFFVTNDHYYREGLMRSVEDVYFGAKWSNIIHVTVKNGEVQANVALTGLHNNNGLSHGRTKDEVLICNAVSGIFHIARVDSTNSSKIQVQQSVEMDSTLDNPSYFADPYADSALDASGIVLPGLSNAISLGKTLSDPLGTEGVMVWLARPSKTTVGAWDKILLLEDDGSRIRSSSAAVLVAIDPATEGGRRRAWLFVTGFMSQSIIAVKVDLDKAG